MNYINRFLFITMAIVVLGGCSKEYSLETGGIGPGGNTLDKYGWQFTGDPSADYHGCIDTAYYETNQGLNGLYIQGTDSAGNSFMIIYVPQNGVVSPGSYGVNTGAILTVTDQNNNTYLPKAPAPFTLQITRVNDTIVEGNFSGTLSSIDNTNFIVKDGKFKALLGKTNPCSGNVPGGGSTDAIFTLTSTGGNCGSPFITGDYYKDVPMDDFNTIEMDVDVTVPGDWQITTTAVNGMVFSGSGTFTSTGSETIVLTGSGTPTATGNISIPIQAGSSTCNFIVKVDPTTVAVPGTGDHFPTTTNSFWIYNVTQLVTGESDSTQVASTGTTVVVNGQTYNRFDGDLFGSVYRKANGNYYRYGSIDLFDVIDSTFKDETIFLKDNAPVNNTWESPTKSTTLGGNNIRFKRIFTIVATGASLTVRGVVYNNVITVKEELVVSVQNTPFQEVEETLLSYARGVGMIQAVNPGYQIRVDLKRFQVF